MKLLTIEGNPQQSISRLVLLGLLVGAGVALFPDYFPAIVVLLVAALVAIYLAYLWPEFFLVLAIWTYFLKFTFLFAVGGLGITPFMIFESLALAGYGLRILSGRDRLILPVGLGFLIVFVSLTTLSLLVVQDLEAALGPYFRTILDWVLMLLLVQMITNRQNLQRLLIALLIQAVVVIYWGIIEALQAWVSGSPLLTTYDSFFWNQFRKNDYAVYLALVSLLSLTILLHARNQLVKLLCVFLLLPIPVTWFITRSRSGLVAIFISTLLFLILERNGKLLRLMAVFSIVVLFSFAIFPSQERDLALDGLRALISPDDVVQERNTETLLIRVELMKAGLETLARNPMLGVGLNQWQFYSPLGNFRRDARTGEIMYDPLEIHNRHLQIATTSGIFALLAYLGFVSTILFWGMRSRRVSHGIVRSLLHALIAFLVAGQITMTVMTGFLWEWPTFGILVGLINLAEIERVGELRHRRWLKFALIPNKSSG